MLSLLKLIPYRRSCLILSIAQAKGEKSMIGIEIESMVGYLLA
jgi:hypothetical protein